MIGSGCSRDRDTDNYYITSSCAEGEAVLKAEITAPAENITINQGESLQFQAVVFGGKEPYTFIWTFDDGPPPSDVLNTQDVLFSAAGTYQVVFLAKDAANSIDSDNITVTVNTSVLSTWYRDADGDGYGDANNSVQDISQPDGYVADNTDPDDTEAWTYPEPTENSDNVVGESSDEHVISTTWYRDADGDGYGDAVNNTEGSSQPDGYVSDNTDCNDGNADIHPNAFEICGDGIDQDCNGSDPACFDMDGDGFDVSQGDCDDTDADIYPGALEVCGDNIDNDCNGFIDEGCTGYSIHGALHHQGVSMYQLTPEIPVLSCRDKGTGQPLPDAAASYHETDGTYDIFNLAGTVDVRVSFWVTGEKETLPGNYLVSGDVDENDAGEHDIEVERIIHLLEPWDNENIEFSSDDPLVVYGSPIRFEWAALPGATRYQVIVSKVRDPDHPDGYGHIENTIDTSVQDTVYLAGLDTSGTDDHYEFTVYAYDGENTIGFYMTTYTDDYGREYCFKISATGIDADGDGYTDAQGDCDDGNEDIHPGAFDVCDDGIDNDCDGLVDEGCVTLGTWQGMYGGNNDDGTRSIRQTSDGGYVMAGFSESTDIPGVTGHGGKDLYIVKLDFSGSVEWQRMYGGNDFDHAYAVRQTTDNGYVVAGYSNSMDIPGAMNHGSYGCYLIKLDRFGDIEWQNMYGGNDFDITYEVEQTTDGGYVLAGYSNSTDIPGVTNNGLWDYYLVKLDDDGNVEWQRVYGGSTRDFAYTVEQTVDGGYIMAGRSNSTDIPGAINNGQWDAYLVKLDPVGNVEWQRMYGGNADDEATSILQTSDGGYIAAGHSESTDIPGVTKNQAADYYIIRLDQTGNVIWQRMYGGGGNDYARSIEQTSDGGYIMAGQSYSPDIPGVTNNGVYDYHIIKLDQNGYIDWQKMYGGSNSDSVYSIEQTVEGGFIMAGQSYSFNIPGTINNGESDCYLIKIDADDIQQKR